MNLKVPKISYVSYINFLAARQESHRLREQVDSTITESANSMWRSWNESNDALRTRIAESTEAHTRLQYHLSRTKQEIYDQEKHVWALKRAIRDKEAPLKVIYEQLYQIGCISFYLSCSWICFSYDLYIFVGCPNKAWSSYSSSREGGLSWCSLPWISSRSQRVE